MNKPKFLDEQLNYEVEPDRTALQKRTRVLFLCWKLPYWGIQSGPILYRHLLRLNECYEVTCIFFSGPIPPNYPFPVLQVPARARFWPPHREGIPGSRLIRDILVRRYIERHLEIDKQDKICVCLHTREHVAARMVSKEHGVPLYCLVHDIWPEQSQDEIIKTLCQTSYVFAVSARLLEHCKKYGARAGEVLLPIGEEMIDNPKVMPPVDMIVVGVSGSLDSTHIETAIRISDKVVVVGPDDVWKKQDPRVKFVPRITPNLDALTFLGEHCNALLIYTSFEVGSAYNCFAFPSKLIDFSQTGLPLILCAPEDSNLGQWAKQNNWVLWLKDINDGEQLASIKMRLRDYRLWSAESMKVRQLALTQFNPKLMHQQFESKLQSRNCI
jgi:hypothetical protein